MGKNRISQEKKIKDYYKIYEQIYEDPTISLIELSKKTKMSRNTISKYLHEMYEKKVLVGPYLEMKSCSNYMEYVYLMNFSDPFFTFKGLRDFPHVVYHAMTSGSWNTLVVTDRHLDFSKLVGFQSLLYQGVKVKTSTPKVEHRLWNESVERISQGAQCTPEQLEPKDRSPSLLTWGNDEWKLFHAFKCNLRQKITPTLHKINVRYEAYSSWLKTLKDFCTIHTEFYPQGREKSMIFSLLISSENDTESCFSEFPMMCPITRIEGRENRFLIFPAVESMKGIKELLSFICRMKIKGIIDQFSYAAVLGDFFHQK